MAMWNKRNIPGKPVFCELKVNITPSVKGTINSAYINIKKSVRIAKEHLDILTPEKYILKRLVYKWSNQFRSKQSLQGLKQINTCLKRLDTEELMSIIESLLRLASIRLDEQSVYLPTRETLQYYLVRLKGMAALLTQTANYCQHFYLVLRQNLQIGDMIPHYVIKLTLTARIWMLSRSLCTYICQWYEGFWPCLNILQATNIHWLSDEEKELPCSLQAWLLDVFPQSALATDVERDMLDSAKEETQETQADFEDLGEPIQRTPLISTDENQDGTEETTESGDAPLDDPQQQQPEVYKALLKHLKGLLKTDQDISDLEALLQMKEFSLEGFQFKLSKKDVRKIVKKLHTIGDQISACSSNDQQVKVLRKKLCRVVAKLLSASVSSKENVANSSLAETLMHLEPIPDRIGDTRCKNKVDKLSKKSSQKGLKQKQIQKQNVTEMEQPRQSVGKVKQCRQHMADHKQSKQKTNKKMKKNVPLQKSKLNNQKVLDDKVSSKRKKCKHSKGGKNVREPKKSKNRK